MGKQELLRNQVQPPGNVNCNGSPFLLFIIISFPLSFLLHRPNGVRFIAAAGTTEFARRWNPQPGDIVSFKHRGFMLISNKPKLATLFRIRNDISWDDVVHNWKERIITPTGSLIHFLP